MVFFSFFLFPNVLYWISVHHKQQSLKKKYIEKNDDPVHVNCNYIHLKSTRLKKKKQNMFYTKELRPEKNARELSDTQQALVNFSIQRLLLI